MKTTLIAQFATLAFALGVTAGPIIARKPLEDSKAAAPAMVHVAARADTTQAAASTKASKTNASKTKAPKTNASKTKASKTKASKTKTGKVKPTGGPPFPTGGLGGGNATITATGGLRRGNSTITATGGVPLVPTDGPGAGLGGDTPAPTATKTGGGKAPKVTAAPGGGSVVGAGGVGGGFPQATGTTVLKAAQTIAAGQSFDGKMAMFDRGVKCTGQVEGGDSDAVFILEEGASISNVIIGPNQIEGIHCNGGCTVSNVWWDAVCEDAFTVKVQAASATTFIKGGGARGATDKVVQHNGAGTINISDFQVRDFGKLYRACGNCAESHERHVVMSGITASSGKLLAGINQNFGDTAKITSSKATGVKEICAIFKGVAKGSEPTEIGSGNDGKSCIYGADVVSS